MEWYLALFDRIIQHKQQQGRKNEGDKRVEIFIP
jgi:hypothetical protein